MQISRWFLLFLFYSFLGWVYESTFRTIKDKQWVNRGFLYGPVCPIYGVCAVGFSLLWNAFLSPLAEGAWRQMFLICFFGSAAMEYVTSWALEKLFHAVWWDYSRLPLNLHGRVSFFTSCGFALAGLLLVYVIAPYTERCAGAIPDTAAELAALLLMAVLAGDLTLTVSALSSFTRVLKQLDEGFNSQMEELVENVYEKTQDAKNRVLSEQENAARALRAMSGATRSALRRVRDFRYPGKRRERVDALLRELRRRVSGKGK